MNEVHRQTSGVTLDFSRPGRPTDNAYIESFNGKFRTECLNANWFLSLDEARQKCEAWLRDITTFVRISVNAGARLHRFPEQRCINDADEKALEHGLVSWASSWGQIVFGRVGAVAA